MISDFLSEGRFLLLRARAIVVSGRDRVWHQRITDTGSGFHQALFPVPRLLALLLLWLCLVKAGV